MRTADEAHPILILASNSPRRKELLEMCGWKFETAPAHVDETPLPAEDPRRYAVRMSESKANETARRSDPQALVLSADTIVVFTHPGTGRQEILGKPVDDGDAWRMLDLLRGRVHQVMTSITLVQRSTGMALTETVSTDVPMRFYTDEEIASYIATRDPVDKAGAYAIQHQEFHPAETLNGCYTNVMGLPICHAARLLAEHGYAPPADLKESFQDTQEFDCLYFQQVIQGRG